MTFSDTRNRMIAFAGSSTPEYQLNYLSSELKDFLSSLNRHYVDHLSKDITESESILDLNKWLGAPYYESANENAKDCLEYCPTVRHIWGRKIKGWTDSALKCYDNLLLKYIQDDKQQIIRRTGSKLMETDVYNHLINNGGVDEEIGQNFIYIYQLRSSFQHIQIEEKGGKRIPKRLSNTFCNRQRDLIINWFKQSLLSLFQQIEHKS